MNNENKEILKGHLCSLLCILVWGTTFVVTKILLGSFNTVEILFIRFVIAFLLLTILDRSRIKTDGIKEELLFVLAGLFGVILYFILETIALLYLSASIVAIVVSIAPFFAAMIASVILKQKNKRYFYPGFVIAITGIAFVSIKDGVTAEDMNLIGIVLTMLAALSWAVYCTITKSLSSKYTNSVAMTRKIFMYGIILFIPLLFAMDFSVKLNDFADIKIIGGYLFLGLLGSGTCFIAWNKALEILGTVKTCIYIYAQPVVTVIFSFIMLNEGITTREIIGIVLICAGLFISDRDKLIGR